MTRAWRRRPAQRGSGFATQLAVRFLGLLLIASFWACSAAPAVQQSMYPPSFTYVDQKDLRTEMWKLAKDVQTLDELLRAQQVSPEEVADVLRRMETTVRGLKDGGEATNHPRLDAQWHERTGRDPAAPCRGRRR